MKQHRCLKQVSASGVRGLAPFREHSFKKNKNTNEFKMFLIFLVGNVNRALFPSQAFSPGFPGEIWRLHSLEKSDIPRAASVCTKGARPVV
jgi:hypothetical protein